MDSFITPMAKIDGINSLNVVSKQAEETNSMPFSSIFENAINDVAETTKKSENNAYLIATGQLDDLHTATIDASQAQLATSLLVQIRNKVLEGYNEIIKMGV